MNNKKLLNETSGMQINHKQSNKKSDIDDILNDDAYGSMLPDHHKRTVITCLTINATF